MKTKARFLSAAVLFAVSTIACSQPTDGSLDFDLAEELVEDTDSEAPAPLPGIVINDKGFVGVGTSEPYGRLHVNGDLWMNIGGTIYMYPDEYVLANSKLIESIPNHLGDPGLTKINFYSPRDYGGFIPSITLAATTTYPAGFVGINNPDPMKHLDVIGFSGGNYPWMVSSDQRWKKNISKLDDLLDRVLQLQPKNYEWRNNEYESKGFPDGVQTGLIAQEVEKVFPELVFADDSGYKSVAYGKLSVLLLQALKEQQRLIAAQDERLLKIEEALSSIEGEE